MMKRSLLAGAGRSPALRRGGEPVIMLVAIGSASVCFLSLLLLCAWIVKSTGKTEGLRDLAQVIAAYRAPRAWARHHGHEQDSGPPDESTAARLKASARSNRLPR